jgi:hypothetical protein
MFGFLSLGVYDLCLIIFSTLGNVLIILVCMRIRNNTTFTFLRCLAISDLFTLFNWNLNGMLICLFDINLFDASIAFCKFASFVQYVTLLVSAWILVTLSFDRYFSMAWANWKTVYLTPRRAGYLSAGILVFFAAINVHVFFTYGRIVQIATNGTSLSECDGTYKIEFYRVWSWVSILNK